MKRRRVIVEPVKISGVLGYDLWVADDMATVQDYLNALNEAIRRIPFYRSRSNRRRCKGCDRCCAERIPLTWIDVCMLKRALPSNGWETGGRGEVGQIIRRVGYVTVIGPVVDITLRRDEDGCCIFLDRQRRICKVYRFRPLVCQTFICCPSSQRAVKLRETVVNKGEDELVRQWLLEARKLGTAPLYDEGRKPRPNLKDWPPTPFTGKEEYRQILLRDVCSPVLWRKLRRNCKVC